MTERAAGLQEEAVSAFEAIRGGRGRLAPAAADAAQPAAGSRDAIICRRYLAGDTLTAIGESLRLSVEGVRKIARRYGLDKTNAGLAVRRLSSPRPRKNTRPAWERVYGCSLLELSDATPEERMVFLQHRTNARRKGIDWALNLAQWVEVWRRSGKWERRGQGPKKYGMTRIDPSRGLVLGNVRICRNLLALQRARRRHGIQAGKGRNGRFDGCPHDDRRSRNPIDGGWKPAVFRPEVPAPMRPGSVDSPSEISGASLVHADTCSGFEVASDGARIP